MNGRNRIDNALKGLKCSIVYLGFELSPLFQSTDSTDWLEPGRSRRTAYKNKFWYSIRDKHPTHGGEGPNASFWWVVWMVWPSKRDGEKRITLPGFFSIALKYFGDEGEFIPLSPQPMLPIKYGPRPVGLKFLHSNDTSLLGCLLLPDSWES